MTDASDLQQRARGFWTRAGALVLMFHRRSSFAGRWSNRLSWCSIGLGTATGIAGLFTVSQDPSAALGLTTGLLGVGTGTINTIREKVLPAELERELWSMRNEASSLQDRFGDIYVEAGGSNRDLEQLSLRLDALAEELRAAESTPHANKVSSKDLSLATNDFRFSRRFANASLSLVGFAPGLLEEAP